MMAGTSSSSKPKIQRASRPKVKSGCITCKKRRVKCDETKPECRRCEAFGCACDGYEFPDRKGARTVPKRLLVPREQGLVQIQSQSASNYTWMNKKLGGAQGGQSYPAHLVRNGNQQNLHEQSQKMVPYDQIYPNITTDNTAFSSVIYSPSITIFESEQEAHYYRFYCDTTAHQLSGGFTDCTWSHEFLQACHEEPFVRRAIIAIAALSKAMDEVSQPTSKGVKALPDIKDTSSKNPHHVFALQQYGKAVRQMRIAITKGNENIRMALISCLLTICFESFHGSHENALIQMGAGLNLMQEWLKKQQNAKHMSGLKSPNPHVMDDRLFHCFMRLDVATMHYYDRRPGEFHREKSLEGLETVQHMPTSFDRLEDAGVYFSVVMKRIMHFIKWIESEALELRYHRQYRLRTTELENTFPNRHLKAVVGPRLAELEGYSAELDRWATAFQPIMDRSKTPEGQIEMVSACFLKLHQKLLVIMLGGMKYHEECLYDSYLPEHKEIVALADTLLGHPYLAHSAGKAVFVFDPNIILPLLIVAIKCRNWVIRRRAIELLQANPRREGTWDSSLAAGIGLWHMSLEEKGLQIGDFVPERNRVRMAGVKQNFEKRTAVLKASQQIEGKMIMHETTVNW